MGIKKLTNEIRNLNTIAKVGLAGMVLGFGIQIGSVIYSQAFLRPEYSPEYKRVEQIHTELSEHVSFYALNYSMIEKAQQLRAERDSLSQLEVFQNDLAKKNRYIIKKNAIREYEKWGFVFGFVSILPFAIGFVKKKKE